MYTSLRSSFSTPASSRRSVSRARSTMDSRMGRRSGSVAQCGSWSDSQRCSEP